MAYNVELTITGIQELQEKNIRRIAAILPTGAAGRVVQYALVELHRYAVAITHVDTGSLRASHRMKLSGLRGEIYIDPGSVNPRSNKRPIVYGGYEEARGGTHAFYRRAMAERGPMVAERGAAMLGEAV